MAPSTVTKIARTLQLSASEIEELFILQQAVAPGSLRHGNSAWECAFQAALAKHSIVVNPNDAISSSQQIGPRLPANASEQISAQLRSRARVIEKSGVNASTVDGVLLRSDGQVSLVCVEITTLIQGEDRAHEQPPSVQPCDNGGSKSDTPASHGP